MTGRKSFLRIGMASHFAVVMALGAAIGCGGPEYPNCDNDEHCHEGEFCVNGACQQCRDNSDCPTGQSCESGRCRPIPGWCNSNADCPEGQECVDNRCVAMQVAETPPEPMAPPPCSLNAVYFAYDSSELDGSARSTLESNASCMNERDVQSVTIVGHCDPRGTEEYNLALGERRARAAQGHLGRLGVSQGRTSIRSMGEEMARGSNESSWAQDRRAEFEER